MPRLSQRVDQVSTGDISGVTAGTNISGGGTSGTVTVNLAVDAAVDMGTDGSGVDVTFHSATAGDNMLWDASDEKLVITGTDGANALEVADGDVEITDQLTVSGGLVAPLQTNAQTGTTYTFVLADAGKMITHRTARLRPSPSRRTRRWPTQQEPRSSFRPSGRARRRWLLAAV